MRPRPGRCPASASDRLMTIAICRNVSCTRYGSIRITRSKRPLLEGRDRHRLRLGPGRLLLWTRFCRLAARRPDDADRDVSCSQIIFRVGTFSLPEDGARAASRRDGVDLPRSRRRHPVKRSATQRGEYAATPSHEAFVHVVNGLAIGQRLEDALWKLYQRVGLPDTPSLRHDQPAGAEAGGSLIETLPNRQDIVRKRVQLFQARQGDGSGTRRPQ